MSYKYSRTFSKMLRIGIRNIVNDPKRIASEFKGRISIKSNEATLLAPTDLSKIILFSNYFSISGLIIKDRWGRCNSDNISELFVNTKYRRLFNFTDKKI